MYVTNIQRFSLDDGPGIRTTVFLAGCNMRCLWCHNPENIEQNITKYDLSNAKDKNFIKNCTEMTVQEIFEQIKKDVKYYQKSNGGITISGGEPFCQVGELEQLLKCCKDEGIHTAVETALNYDYDMIERLNPYLDLIIADCKAVTESIHIKCTGVSNKKILINIEELSNSNKRFWIRIPIVPDINITIQEINKIGRFLSDKVAEKIELLPYHKMGIKKYEALNLEYKLYDVEEPNKTFMKECFNALSMMCISKVEMEGFDGKN